MNTCDFREVLEKLFKQSQRTNTVFAVGPPGVGKTAIVSQAAKAAGKQLLTFALPTCEAVDLRGLPQVVNGRTKWMSPMPRDGEGVILLDELSSAPPDVQVAAHHLVWSEEGSDMSLPRGWHVVLTGNRAADKTLYRGVSGPLRNRLTIINVDVEVGQWAEWAMANQIAPEIIGFIRWRPELLAVKEVPTEGAFHSPRAWQEVNSILSFAISASIERELLVGTIGEGPTTEFSAYLRTVRELPTISSILNNPFKADIPSSPAMLYALVTALAQHTREKGVSAMPYVRRIPSEFALLYIRDVRDHYEIGVDKDIREWISKHKTLFDRE